MEKKVSGFFTKLDGFDVYKIENYDCMDNFFMTITSSSDIWNFCWSQGGITAGRIDSNHAIFPYYTADKVADFGAYTGPYTCVSVKMDDKSDDYIEEWEPFAYFYMTPVQKRAAGKYLLHNIYKNFNGTRVWFEEINTKLNLAFRTGWTSSEKYGLVRTSCIENLSDKTVQLTIFDGCRNIFPACCTSDFQNEKSNLLDAYKKTDLDTSSGIVMFTVSSIVSDKAEPNEGLYANTCWFSTNDKVLLTSDNVDAACGETSVLKGKRPACYIARTVKLASKSTDNWYQVFDTWKTVSQIMELQNQLKDRAQMVATLEKDIADGDKTMTDYLAAADGIQNTANKMACLHHQQNVMFNIMRGGIFANVGGFEENAFAEDFKSFVLQRNKALAIKINSKDVQNSRQFKRLLLEYMPLTFSRRHGDPSRPWNIFNINLKDRNGNAILNYEGNWRDIFQNWEALAYSYPKYVKNMIAKFLNAMTIDGFNPYKINRKGIDWEIPDPNNPWAQIGYWGDHQVIYLEKFLEFYNKTNRAELLASVDEQIYTSSNVPYRIKSYADILKNPRDTIVFDRELSNRLKAEETVKGSDARLVQGKDDNPYLVSFAAKVLQIVNAKLANFVPGGGIWLNTQRPEWNDANNALAGYGLSVVTLCYLYRFVVQLIDIFSNTKCCTVKLPVAVNSCFEGLSELYGQNPPEETVKTDEKRKLFVDAAQRIFETERNELYENGYNAGEIEVSVAQIVENLKAVLKHLEYTIWLNQREDGLFHSYNTLKITCNETLTCADGGKMEVFHLQEMLEGQVAVLSSKLLNPDQALEVIAALKNSKMYEPHQNSYMLYPNKELPGFLQKNCIPAAEVLDAKVLAALVKRTGNFYLESSADSNFHFNPDFRNEEAMITIIEAQTGNYVLSGEEKQALFALYEKTFNHQSFTGRSGTFYAYEGLGSIYWHMDAKLLLAVQENLLTAKKLGQKTQTDKLIKAYYDVRSGLSYNKTPELYGAFPADPYSHTPYLQGAKQPGMTGQVKEEILTRWGELGVCIENGIASFEPFFLQADEVCWDGVSAGGDCVSADEDCVNGGGDVPARGSLEFTWCGAAVKYEFGGEKSVCPSISVNDQPARDGNSLFLEESQALFARNGKIQKILVKFN